MSGRESRSLTMPAGVWLAGTALAFRRACALSGVPQHAPRKTLVKVQKSRILHI
jgi:hypothetical protein